MARPAILVVLATACAASSRSPGTTPGSAPRAAPVARSRVVVSELDTVTAGPVAAPAPVTDPGRATAAAPVAAATGAGGEAAGTAQAAPQPVVIGLPDGELALDEAWRRWHAGLTATFEAMFELAVLANRARPLATADDLMVSALTRAVTLSACDPDRLGRIRLLAIAVRDADHPPALTGELRRLSDLGPVECARGTVGPGRSP